MIIKRAGQIVPRWLVKSLDRKQQHLLKFGCDVEINCKSRTVKATSDGFIFLTSGNKYTHLKGQKRLVKGFDFLNISVEGFCSGAVFVRWAGK